MCLKESQENWWDFRVSIDFLGVDEDNSGASNRFSYFSERFTGFQEVIRTFQVPVGFKIFQRV